MKGIAYCEKRYVAVAAETDDGGRITPLWIRWPDGRKFIVEEVLDSQQAASRKVGGNGIRYVVRVSYTDEHNDTCCKETFLFFEDPLWFVEEIIREQ